jgi:hypothetical protein
MRDADNRGGYPCVGAEGIKEICTFCSFYKPKTTLKINSFIIFKNMI